MLFRSLVLLPDASRPNGLALPEVGRLGPSGSASQLHDLLQREGLDATLGFLFAVFENPGTREQCIYYRGEALLHARGRTVLADFEDIPWDRLPDEATRSMLRRYTEADCIPMQSANPPLWDSVLQNVHLEASMAAGTVKISEAFTARKVFVHASPTDIRIRPGSVLIREDTPGAVTLYEYSLSPVRLQNRVEVRREDLPPVCKP